MGAGPTHCSQSNPSGIGSPSGGLPIPFGHSFWTWKHRTAVTLPIPPDRMSSAASWQKGLDIR